MMTQYLAKDMPIGTFGTTRGNFGRDYIYSQ